MPPDWKRELAQSFSNPAEAFRFIGWDPPSIEGLEEAARSFSMRIPRYYLSLIDPDDPDDPIGLQCLPSVEELRSSSSDIPDAVGDQAMSPVPGIVRKHKNRVVLLVSHTCSMYCRFCFRRPVSSGHTIDGLRDKLESAFDYISRESEIREVIFSGGDPLMLEDSRLEALLHRCLQIPHIRLLRIHTRAPVTLPSRVTSALIRSLEKNQPLTVVTHFNHPQELSPEALEALKRLRLGGVPLLNQSVLLKGVNDSADTLTSLFFKLLESGVIPYYLHHCDRSPGNGRFRCSIASGLEIMAELRKRLPGPALPRYVLDVPDGSGKVCLEPTAARPLADHAWLITTQTGLTFRYDEPPETVDSSVRTFQNETVR